MVPGATASTARERYDAALQRRMRHRVWSSGCHSGYLSPDGSNHALYPGFAAEYVLRTRRRQTSEYEIAHFPEGAP